MGHGPPHYPALPGPNPIGQGEFSVHQIRPVRGWLTVPRIVDPCGSLELRTLDDFWRQGPRPGHSQGPVRQAGCR